MASWKTAKLIRLLHRVIVAVLVLAALGTVSLWVDSYRIRPPVPAPPTYGSDGHWLSPLAEPPPNDVWFILDDFGSGLPVRGLNWSRFGQRESGHVNQVNYFVRALEGVLNLQRHVGIETGTHVPRIQRGVAGVRYNTWVSIYAKWESGQQEYAVKELRVPIWLLTVLLAAYPVVALVRAVRRTIVLRRARKSGHCLNCMYDLTGNVSGVCPECGVAIQSHVTPSPSAWHLNK